MTRHGRNILCLLSDPESAELLESYECKALCNGSVGVLPAICHLAVSSSITVHHNLLWIIIRLNASMIKKGFSHGVLMRI